MATWGHVFPAIKYIQLYIGESTSIEWKDHIHTKSTTKGPVIQIKDANVADIVNPVLLRDVGNI